MDRYRYCRCNCGRYRRYLLACVGHHRPDRPHRVDRPLTEEEIELVIKEMPSEKAPSPDGFIGLFYKKYWTIIKEDLIHATYFYSHRTAKLNLINAANIVLLP
jgi:hypothetical protein